MKKLVFLFLIVAPLCHAQGTFTAATCNFADVNTLINGPTHTAVSGDTIQVPAGSCTWTSQLVISTGITLIGNGTPNTTPSTYGPGTLNTTLTDNASGVLIAATVPVGQILRISTFKISPISGTTAMSGPITIIGVDSASARPTVRIDNMDFSAWAQGNGNGAAATMRIDNVIGVIDHNSSGTNNQLANVSHSAWLGVGQGLVPGNPNVAFGDNSWASADTFGTNQALYFENNIINGMNVEDCGEFPPAPNSGGGCRIVSRFNKTGTALPASSGGFNYFHGTDTDQRPRGGRALEQYANTVSATGGIDTLLMDFRSGTGFIFGNDVTTTGANSYFKGDVQRVWRGSATYGSCDGGAPWDANDGVVYFSGTISAVSPLSGGNFTVTVSGTSPGWTVGQWVSIGSAFAFHDVTQSNSSASGSRGLLIVQNTANTLSITLDSSSSGALLPAVNDSFQILRAKVCMDQPGRGAGALITGSFTAPVLLSTGNPGPVNQAIDPIYEMADIANFSGGYFHGVGDAEIGVVDGINRDFYEETLNQSTQTSPTSPFNGTTGNGHGNLANRPTTCTPGVGYFATDQGSWNTSGNTFPGATYSQGRLATCRANNVNQTDVNGNATVCSGTLSDGHAWCSYYTPFTYPHPCTTSPTCSSGPAPSVTISPSPIAFGNQAVGVASSPMTVTVNNIGNATLTLSTPFFVVAGTNPTDFAESAGTCTNGGTVAAGSNCTLLLTFTPAANGARSATLTINGNAVGFANITGTGGSATCPQNLPIGPYSLCGETYNNLTSGTSVSVNYTPNPGNGIIAWATWCFVSTCKTSTSGVTATIGDNINGTEPCFTASPNSPFITNANGGAQGAGDFQQFYVWYCPSIPFGVNSFTMTPSSTSLSFIQLHVSEWLTGSLASSCSPVAACFESVDNFGQAGGTVGTTATITTTGSTINPNDLIFAVTQVPCCSFTGSAGAGYTGITTALASNPGMVVEAKSVTSTGSQTATSTWTGGSTNWFGIIAPIKNSGAIVGSPVFGVANGNTWQNFPVLLIGQNISQDPVIQNNGGANLIISNITITGANASDFSFAAQGCPLPPITLAPTSNCNILLTFSPSAVGVRTAILTFVDNAPDSPQTFTLTGTVLNQPPPANTIFGAANLGGCPVCAGSEQCFCFTQDYHLYRSLGNSAVYTAFWNPAPAPPVTSVNGKKGAVVLTVQ